MSHHIAQGTLDGFCGIYASAHLIAELSSKPDGKIITNAFFQILRSLERDGKLTAKRIASPIDKEIGFSCNLIANAINSIPARSGFGMSAIPFTSTAFKNSEFHRNARRAFADGCGFVMQVDRGNHWVSSRCLAPEGGYAVFDPSHDRDHTIISRIFWDEGLMIGPRNLVRDI